MHHAVAVLVLLVAVVRAQQVRQCSCPEAQQCINAMKPEAEACVDTCWSVTGKLTQRPQDLRQCFRSKSSQIERFITCFSDAMQGCSASAGGPMIPRQDFGPLIAAAEHSLRQKAKGAMIPGMEGQLRNVIATAEEFGNCYKQCFQNKVAGGICLQFGCQPLLPDQNRAKQIFSKCSAGVNIKKEGGPLCDCALRAGVSQLATYCPVLALMGNRG